AVACPLPSTLGLHFIPMHHTPMRKVASILALCLSLLVASPVCAEVGETNVIDAIATKPESRVAILLLFQARAWNEESIGLFNRKVEFYALAIGSGSLVQQKPELQGKALRIIVIYERTPPAIVETRLRELQESFSKSQVGFVWGEQRDLATLATKP
ncbi:MAG TPA: DUF6572 domain-containing protein, partial [Albitalea sp.]|nr:DUF6572 domain-containing protein [Albitalea sp.]